MKQGEATSSRSGSTKPATYPHDISPEAASQIGEAVAYHAPPLIMGQGVHAPKMHSCTTSNCGSQGKR